MCSACGGFMMGPQAWKETGDGCHGLTAGQVGCGLLQRSFADLIPGPQCRTGGSESSHCDSHVERLEREGLSAGTVRWWLQAHGWRSLLLTVESYSSGSTTVTPTVTHACGGGHHSVGGGVRVDHSVSPSTSIGAHVYKAPFSGGTTAGLGLTFRF